MTAATTSKKQYFYSAGKRKSAVARVKLYQDGSGKVSVNGKDLKEYFVPEYKENALAPLVLADQKKSVDIEAQILGGGKAAQSDALRHGISRTLILFDPELRTTLKRAGFLRRDARIKERKKPGLKRARRAPQWKKR
jgi:small subunit ribosomal protein S9